MFAIGPLEWSVLLLISAVLVCLAVRNRTPPLVSALLVIILSPLVASSLTLILVTVFSAFASA